jgi:predicted amidophosphoribosyltransferase
VVLVDDVLTSGATAAACTKTLMAAGAATVDVLTFARVVREGEGA